MRTELQHDAQAIATAAGDRVVGALTLAVTALTTFVLGSIHAQTEGASATLLIGRAADAEVLIRAIESGADVPGAHLEVRQSLQVSG